MSSEMRSASGFGLSISWVRETEFCGQRLAGDCRRPISRSLTASCVSLELRPLPSPDVTRLQRYYKPLRHPTAPSLSLTGVWLGKFAHFGKIDMTMPVRRSGATRQGFDTGLIYP